MFGTVAESANTNQRHVESRYASSDDTNVVIKDKYSIHFSFDSNVDLCFEYRCANFNM